MLRILHSKRLLLPKMRAVEMTSVFKQVILLRLLQFASPGISSLLKWYVGIAYMCYCVYVGDA